MQVRCGGVGRALVAAGIIGAVAVAAPGVAHASASGTARPDASPSITSISVASVNRDEKTTATIAGSGFTSGTKVSLGPSVKTKVTAEDPTSLTVTLAVSKSATVGSRTLRVTVPHGGTATLDHAVYVDYAPVFERWAIGDGASDFTTTLVRPEFASTPSLAFSGGGVTVVHRQLASGSLEVTFSVGPTAAATWRSMLLVDGASSWLVPRALKIRVAPKVLSVTPLGQGESDETVRVTGKYFEDCPGPPVVEPTLSVSGPGVTVNSVSGALSTVMYANVSVASGAPIGERDVTVTNCDSEGTSTSDDTFQVLGPPLVTSVPAIAIGVTRTETVKGSDFAPGTTLSAAGSGVTFSDVTYVSPTRLHASVSVAANATTGPRSVTAADSSTSHAAAYDVLSVDSLPTESSLAPVGVGANSAIVLTVHGSGFEPGAAVVVESSGRPDRNVAVGPAVVTSSTELDVVVAAKGGLALGNDTVEVVNPDGGAASTLVLRTDPAPVLTSVESSPTKVGEISLSFTAPIGSPAGESYSLELCENAAMTERCGTRVLGAGGGVVAELVAGTRYFAVVVAHADGEFSESRSDVSAGVLATTRLSPPSIVKVASSTKLPGAVVVRFLRPKNAPASQRFTATACRNVQMTVGCVSGSASYGAALQGLAPGAFYRVDVKATASAGYLASVSTVSAAVKATVQLKAPTISTATLAHGHVTVDFKGPSNRPPAQRYTLLACTNATMTSGCVAQSYRSGTAVKFKGANCYVRVTADASSGYLAAASKTKEASKG